MFFIVTGSVLALKIVCYPAQIVSFRFHFKSHFLFPFFISTVYLFALKSKIYIFWFLLIIFCVNLRRPNNRLDIAHTHTKITKSHSREFVAIWTGLQLSYNFSLSLFVCVCRLRNEFKTRNWWRKQFNSSKNSGWLSGQLPGQVCYR